MVKQTKRLRKFQSSGGVSSRLKKGTITNKGKLRRSKGRSQNDEKKTSKAGDSYSQELEHKRTDENITSRKNLGDLDLESFFTKFAEDVDQDSVASEDSEGAGDDNKEDDDGSQSDEEEQNSSDSDDEEEEVEKSSKPKKKQAKESAKAESSDESESEMEDPEEIEQKMKEEIENDPEFHQFLQENDETLLDFENDVADGDMEVADDDDDEAEDGKDKTKDPSKGGPIRLTPDLLKRMEQGAFDSHGVKSLKKYINAFKSACHMSDADQEESGKGSKYHIESSVVFDHLMITALGRCQEEFQHHLLPKDADEGADADANAEKEIDEVFDENKPLPPKQLEKIARWADLKPLIQVFFKAAMHLLTEAKEPDLLAFVLKALAGYTPFCSPFPRLAESMLKTLISLWSAPIDASEDYQVVRLHAFLRIRQLALTQPFPFIETCLKKAYLAYAQRAKFTASSTASLPTLTFMGNSIVELYSLDYHSSYQHAFVYIRQLALHLRSAIQKKTAEAFAVVYCWQYIHCLKLWVAVLTEACQSKEPDSSGEDQLLRSLLFPLSQVILGTCRLIPSARYLPLRLHCVRLLQQLAAAAEVFLPTTSILFDALDLKELYQQPKKATKGNVQPLPVTLKLRADSPLRTMEELEMCVSEVFVLLNRELDLYRYSAGFPEFSIRVIQRLKKFSKDTRSSRWRAYSKGCIDIAERHTKTAVEGRSKLSEIAPKDVKRLEILKPMNAPTMSDRFKSAVMKEKRLEVATRPAQKKPNAKRGRDAKAAKADGAANESTKRKKPKAPRGEENEAALVEEDKVQTGIDWSDEE